MSSPPSGSTPAPLPSSSSSTPASSSKGPPSLSLQGMVPPLVSVHVPSAVDIPFRRCMYWRTWTMRSELSRKSSTTSLCWRRLAPERPRRARFPAMLPLAGPSQPTTSTTQNTNPGSTEANAVSVPEELSVLRGRIIEYHVTVEKNPPDPADAIKILLRSDPQGAFRGLEVQGKGAETKHSLMGYEVTHDTGYHYFLPVGLIHHNIYTSMAQHFDRTYGPTVRLLNSTADRIQKSYTSGKQLASWSLIWSKFENAEGLKLWMKLCGQVRVMSDRAKDADKKDESGSGKSQT